MFVITTLDELHRMIKDTQYEFVYNKFVDNLSAYVCETYLDGNAKSVKLTDVIASINILKFISKEKFNVEILTDKAYDNKKDVVELFSNMISKLKKE